MVDNNKDDKLDSEIAKRLDDLFGEGDAFSDDSSALKAKGVSVNENKSKDQQRSAADDEIVELEEVAASGSDEERIPADYPLAELKNMVLSIDWEITDEVLAGFLSQINGLKDTYKKEKIILMFLQLLGSLGTYIKTNRGNAHPKTFKILNSVFSRLEDVVLAKGMAESEKKKILRVEMDKYKQLRQQVSNKKAVEVGRRKTESLIKDKPYVSAPKAPKEKKAGVRPDKASATAEEKNRVPASVAAEPYDTLAAAVKELKQFIHSELRALRQELKIVQKSK